MKNMELRLGGVGAAWQGMGLSGDVVFVTVYPPLVVYQGESFAGTLGISGLVSNAFQIPDDLLADFGDLAGKRGVIEVTGAVLVSSNADFEFRLQNPGRDGSFTDAAKSLKKNVTWTGFKLGTIKVDFALHLATSIAGEHIRKMWEDALKGAK